MNDLDGLEIPQSGTFQIRSTFRAACRKGIIPRTYSAVALTSVSNPIMMRYHSFNPKERQPPYDAGHLADGEHLARRAINQNEVPFRSE
jgi:hypothetical protein